MIVSTEIVQAIRAVVQYNWADEEQDHKENPGPDHIYQSLRTLDAWLAAGSPANTDVRAEQPEICDECGEDIAGTPDLVSKKHSESCSLYPHQD